MTDPLSLLFPADTKAGTIFISEQTRKDLDLEIVLRNLEGVNERVREIFLNPPNDLEDIRYRQEVFNDFFEHPELVEAFEKVLPVIDDMERWHRSVTMGVGVFYMVVHRIGELEAWSFCVETLHRAFEVVFRNPAAVSRGLGRLKRLVETTFASPLFQDLRKELPELADKVRSLRSITIGVNLGSTTLRPLEATILSLNDTAFTQESKGLFRDLFGNKAPEFDGLTPLRPSGSHPVRSESSDLAYERKMGALLDDLSDLMEKASRPVLGALNKFLKVETSTLLGMRDPLRFYLAGVRLFRRLKEKGIEVCRPEVLEVSQRRTYLSAHQNIALVLRNLAKEPGDQEMLVPNDAFLGDAGSLLLVTGPNQGGKTVFTQGIGLSHILFQCGWPVTAREASLSPVDGVFTHFQIEETMAAGTGRFGHEAQRLAAILNELSPSSLLLMNESFASTNPTESLLVAVDVLKILKMLGVRTVFAHHLYPLSEEVETINADVPGPGRLVNLVSRIEQDNSVGEGIRRTFRIVPGVPEGKSYAREIAARYGLQFEGLKAMFTVKGFFSS